MGLCLGKGGPREDDQHQLRGANASGGHGSAKADAQDSQAERWPRRHKITEAYTMGKKLGEGATAQVFQGTAKKDGREVAVKQFNKRVMEREDVDALMEEVHILKELHHQNVIEVYDFLEDKEHYYVVMELVRGGELFDRITTKTVYTEKEARDLFRIVAEALKYCHDHDVVHRDLKLENLLLRDPEDDVTVAIADFGFAAKCPGDENKLYIQCGTPCYMAPEVIRGELYGKAVDMWSLGVITYILLGGYPPFFHQNQFKMFLQIKKGKYDMDPKYWGHVSDDAKDLIRQMLLVDASRRLTVAQALEHPWVKEDDHVLSGRSLENTKDELRKFNARRKFRAGIQGIMAANQMGVFLEKIRSTHKETEEDGAVRPAETAAATSTTSATTGGASAVASAGAAVAVAVGKGGQAQ